MPFAAARARSPPAARSSPAPASSPAAPRATNISSRKRPRKTTSGGAASTSRSPEAVFDRMLERVRAYFQGKELFVQDLHGGADPAYRLKVRVVTDSAWHSLFVRNMFIRPKVEELADFTPDFTILHAPKFFGDALADGTASDTFILVEFRPAPRADRRHRICRRDQEMRVRLSEFHAAGQGRAADALLGQCRPARRQRRVLRPFRHRQDHAVRRRLAHPDRRRRAWLERSRPLQFRGRLLRQGDQSLRRARARNLCRDPSLRHGAGERRARSADARARSRPTAASPRTRAPAIRSTSFRTPTSTASRRIPKTSSC